MVAYRHARAPVLRGQVEAHFSEKYRLFADDGSYDIEMLLDIDKKVRGDAVEIDFEGIFIGPRYTLTVTNEAGEVFTIFEGLAFPELHALSERLEAGEKATG